MKRLKTRDGKIILLAQTGLAMIFILSGSGAALAQTASPSAAPVSIDSAIPGVPATPAAAAVPAPATPAASAATAPANAPSASGTAPAVSPVAQETLPAATKSEAASQPSAAELAIVQNATTMNAMTPAQPAGSGSGRDNGLRVTDILATPANIRPLPKDYLVVKKDHGANETDSRLTAARLALGQGHYQAALELFDDLYRRNPRDIRISMGRAVALQKLGQTDEAMTAYQAALRTDPHNIEALTNMLGLLKGKDTATAIKKLEQLRGLYPANADVTAQLGMVYGVAGDYNNALKYLNMADALKPGNPTILYDKAVAYDRMGNTVDAAQLYRQILLLASDGSLDQSFPLEQVRQRLAAIR
jgi:Flp pilus assembly protein TadD